MVVYLIRNAVNGKGYVGQTRSRLAQRLASHAIASTRTSAIAAAIAEYGRQAFTIEALQVCQSQEDLNIAECEWIARLNTAAPHGYNLREGGRRGRLSSSTRQKLSQRTVTEETRRNLSDARRGRKMPEAQRLKMVGQQPPWLAHRQDGEHNGNARLTAAIVAAIRRRYAGGGISQEALAREYGVKQVAISRAIRGATWR